MIYLIFGTDLYLRDKEIKKIVGSNDVFKFDLDENSLKDIINDADTNSLFSTNKFMIVNNSYIFSAKKNSIDHDTNLLLEYFSNLNPDTTIIFLVDTEKLDERKKITKKIKEIGKVIEINPKRDIKPIVRNMFDHIKVPEEVLDLLISRVGNNLYMIENEVAKLKLIADSVITVKDVINVTSKNSEPDIFLFIESIVNKNIKKSYQIYNDLMVSNEEPIKIIVMLANQFRLIYQAKLLVKRGYDLNYIASALDIHPYRVKLALESGRNYDEVILLNYIKELADIDYKIKIGEIDKTLAFELFILNI